MSAIRSRSNSPGRLFPGAVLTALLVSLVLDAGDEGSLAHLARATGLVAYAMLLVAGTLTYFYWRTVSATGDGEPDDRIAPWLTVGLTAGAAMGLLQVTEGRPGHAGWLVIGQLAVLLALCVCAAVADRVDLPAEPALVGLGVAVAIPAAFALLRTVAAPISLGRTGSLLLNAGVVLTGAALAWIILRRMPLSPWARHRLAAATVLLTLAQCIRNMDPQSSSLMVGAIAGYLVGAVLLCSMADQLLRSSVRDSQLEITRLHRSLAEIRASVAQDREMLHEVGATLAGITTASRVIHQPHGVTSYQRQRLAAMLTAELARLERLMDHRLGGGADHEDDDRLIWLDEVVEPIVTSHQARGRRVSWQPSGQHAFGAADDVAELCNILLENAAQHAPGAPVSLSVAACDGGVRVVCSDRGPGVAPEARPRLFEAEVKGDRSAGQGLGLSIARRLVAARGGSVELLDDGQPGATFVGVLPAREQAKCHAHHVA